MDGSEQPRGSETATSCAEPSATPPAEPATAPADSRPAAAEAGQRQDGPAGKEEAENGGQQAAQPAQQGWEKPAGTPLTGRIYYLVGGTLPPKYNDWLSWDLTGPGWRLRQALRPFLLMLPFAVMFALLPGQISVRVTIVVFLLVAGIGLGFATSGYFRNRRLVQHGFPPVFPSEDREDEGYRDEDERPDGR